MKIPPSPNAKIPNHIAPALSKLDLLMAQEIPPGGNWKNIPEVIPSKRLELIRRDFAQGKGSRSTYYGRLKPDYPSYTINTYFSRPGNGCHLHYDYDGNQHRVLSYREAARLQSFPDSFVFFGSKSSVQTQIGNAVPPLLAFQIAQCLPLKGNYIDLFSGCGGLSYGFKLAGWKPVVANEFNKAFAETYKYNIGPEVVIGDIRDKNIFNGIVDAAVASRNSSNEPLWIIGGPPCQGFSTAGKKRSMDDNRNWLFKEFKSLIQIIKPDGFVFENVPGLINMQKGEVLSLVKQELKSVSGELFQWVLKAEQHGIPQRRTRLIIIGLREGLKHPLKSPAVTTMLGSNDLYKMSLFENEDKRRAISVQDALSDLPPLQAGQDGSQLQYISEPSTSYQALMRGIITVEQYLSDLTCKVNTPELI